jgi:hypothetical protein
MQELLRCRDIAGEFAALLRHRSATAGGTLLHISLELRLSAWFGGRGRIANIDVATSHDFDPSL